MERINGFLCIDECVRKIANEEKGHYWVYINGVEYYFKPAYFEDGLFCGELIAYYGSKILGIKSCFYDLAILDGKKGYISKSLRGNDVKLVSGEVILGDYLASYKVVKGNLIKSIDIIKDMGFDEADIVEEIQSEEVRNFCADYINNLEIIWQALEDRYSDKIDIADVMYEFILMYLFTILFKDMDKHPANWMIVEGKNGINLAPLFDNELILSDCYDCSCLSVDFKDFSGIMKSLMVFFEVSSLEYFELFVNMFERIVKNFELVFDMVEKQIGVKIDLVKRAYIMEMFDKNSQTIREVIDDYLARHYKIRCRNRSILTK